MSRKSRRRAFGPTELFLIIAVLALLISVLLPSCSMAKENAKRAQCASNLSQIARGLYVYAQPDQGDKFPSVFLPRKDSAATYWHYRTQMPTPKDVPSPTADLWILILANSATPKLFVCPSTPDEPDPAQDPLAFYDFAAAKNLSYAYQYMYDPDRPNLGCNYEDPTIPLAADANPYIKGGVKTMADADRASPSRGNTMNHRNREGGNLLFLDSHVDFVKSPDAGLMVGAASAKASNRGRDNFYTVHSKTDGYDPGTTEGLPKTVNLASKSDACLVP